MGEQVSNQISEEDLDPVNSSIIENVGEKGTKISGLEDHVPAARQTIWNRVDRLIETGYLKDSKGGFPPVRFLTLTEKGKLASEYIRVRKKLIPASEKAKGLLSKMLLAKHSGSVEFSQSPNIQSQTAGELGWVLLSLDAVDMSNPDLRRYLKEQLEAFAQTLVEGKHD